MSVATSADGTRLFWTETGLTKDPYPGVLAVANSGGVVQNRIAGVYDPDDITLTPNGKKAYVTDTRSGRFTVVDLPTDASPTKIAGTAGSKPWTSRSPRTNADLRLRQGPRHGDRSRRRDQRRRQADPLEDPGRIAMTPDGAHALVVSGRARAASR